MRGVFGVEVLGKKADACSEMRRGYGGELWSRAVQVKLEMMLGWKSEESRGKRSQR